MSRALAEQRGRRAERIAAWYLRMKGWRIVGTRVRTPVGEIDIVARRFRTTAFVEVKTRGTLAELDYAVDKHRLRRVAAAASALAARHAFPGGDIRIDVILVAPGRMPKHLSNVWEE
ncbi:YraN family protein [Sphingomonas sp. SUN039]|uniref:YraN family protein n=1 Tax=Sphingomonas sp. SUN039 TaxID=2937787 RepID=UPI0021643AC9|nr:YraN family protein [Sphingomonas sp. SUN039]UVO54046.1 YraN family protein [Sphingomonas sp. SUN039]